MGSEEVAAALATINLASYAQAFDDEGWDDLEHLKSLDAEGLREVAASVKMKTGHVSRLLAGFGSARSGEAPPPLMERKTSSVLPVGFGPDGQPVFASDDKPPAAVAPAAAPAAPPVSSEGAAAGWCDPESARPQQPPQRPAPVATPDAATSAAAAASAAQKAVPPSPGTTQKSCVGLRIVIEKSHPTQKLGMCLAMSKGYLRLEGAGGGSVPVGYFTVMELDPAGLAAQSGNLMLGDMVTSVNGQPVSTLQDTTKLLATSERAVLEVQRLQDETLLGAVLEEVSHATYAAEQRRKSQLTNAEDVLLQSVLQASKDDHGAHVERAALEEEEQLRLALQASRVSYERTQEQSEVDEIRDEAMLGGVIEQSFISFQRKEEKRQQAASAAAPVQKRGSAAALAAAGLPASLAGVPEQPPAAATAAAAAAASSSSAGAAPVDVAHDQALRGTAARSVSRPEWLDVQEPLARSDTITRVYDAQRRFVLISEEDDESDADFSRRNSQMF